MIRKLIATLSLAVVLSLAGGAIGTKPAFAGCKPHYVKLSEGQSSHNYTCQSKNGCTCSAIVCSGASLKQTCIVNGPTSVKIDKPTPPKNCKNVSSDAVKWKQTWNGVQCTYGAGCLCFAVLCTGGPGTTVFVQDAKCQTVSP